MSAELQKHTEYNQILSKQLQHQIEKRENGIQSSSKQIGFNQSSSEATRMEDDRPKADHRRYNQNPSDEDCKTIHSMWTCGFGDLPGIATMKEQSTCPPYF